MNLDNCGAAMYMLFQLAAGAGWDELMFQAVDMVGIDMQPKPNSNTAIGALFFVGLTVLGNFVNHWGDAQGRRLRLYLLCGCLKPVRHVPCDRHG